MCHTPVRCAYNTRGYCKGRADSLKRSGVTLLVCITDGRKVIMLGVKRCF